MILDKLNTLAEISSTKEKENTLKGYIDNGLLKRVLYMGLSKKVKFYIKVIPNYIKKDTNLSLANALDMLTPIVDRELTGDLAKDHLSDILSRVDIDDAIVIKRIIDKDMKIGMGVRSVNASVPKLIETTPYMGAVSFNKSKADKIIKSGFAVSQEKMDGRYANVVFDDDCSFHLESRQGEPTHIKGALFKALEDSCLSSVVLNGELTMDGIDRYTSNGIISSIVSIRKKESEGKDINKELLKFEKSTEMSIEEAEDLIVYTTWDSITLNEYFDNKSPVKYEKRLENTRKYVDMINNEQNNCCVKLIETTPVLDYATAMSLFQDKIKEGKEGTLIKSLDSTWKNGKPAWQVKMKLEMKVDLKIVGFNDGKIGTKNEGGIGSIVCESIDGIVKADPYGINDDDRAMFNECPEKFIGEIVEVKSCGLSQNAHGEYSLLHPSFVRLRDDKDKADSLNDIIQNENMIKGLTAAIKKQL